MSTVGNWKVASAAAGPALVYNLDAATYTGISASFNGTTQNLAVAANTALTLGTNDHTIEFWMYQTSRGSYAVPWAYDGTAAQLTGNYYLLIVGGLSFSLGLGNGAGGYAVALTLSPTPSLNAWHHYAIVRIGTTFTVYVDGVSVGSATSSQSISAQVNPMYVGYQSANGRVAGRVSNLRVVVGLGVYTGAFTPPTSPLTVTQSAGTNISAITTQTQLLLPLTTVPYTDSSTNAIVVTNTGTVVPILSTPFTSYDTTGTYSLTIANAGASISYGTTNSGVFSKTTATGTDYIYGGPNWVTGQSYSVFMVYQRTATSAGRLLNTQSEVSKDWLMGLYNGNPDTFYPNVSVNLPASGADLIWHFGWATWNTTTSLGQLYIATNTQPTAVAFSTTNAGGGGFNQLRMFSRAAGTEVQTGNIGFIKVYNGVIDLATVQSLYATYKARFGY
jgi:hypothetical protein